jgi:aminoglycoside 3-N-acetyltransferase
MLTETKILLREILPHSVRALLKRQHRRVKNKLSGENVSESTLHDIENILIEGFGIKKGDNLIVSSSFGNLNANFTPGELILLLQDLVGKEGNIVMPFYPPGNSYEWAKSGRIFDMKKTRSSMGILTQVFSNMPDVFKSRHPTKAVVAWGKNAGEIIKGHEKSTTPFYWNSPYGWLLKHPSKSLGLGLRNTPVFHAVEDIVLKDVNWFYFPEKVSLKIKDYNGEIFSVDVFVHDPAQDIKSRKCRGLHQ